MNVGTLAAESLAKHGTREAILFEGTTITNAEMDERAGLLAAVLRARGVVPGDRVLVMMPNSPAVLQSFQACWKIGAALVPVTPMMNAREVRFLLEDSGARVAITAPILAARVEEAARGIASCEGILVLGETAVAGTTDIDPELAAATPVRDLLDREPDDLAVLLYTSGTTGHPKGVMLTHGNLLSNARGTAALVEVEIGQTVMHVLPLSHSFGVMMMNVGLIYATRAVLLPFFDAVKALDAIQTHKVRQFSAVPTMLTMLLNHPDRQKYDTTSLERVVSGGAALPNETRVEFERVFGCKVREGYGLSETSPTACGYRDEEEVRVGSVGRAIPGVKIEIRDNDGRALHARQIGEICIQGPNVMKGYWKNPEATAEAIQDGWLRSGDVGYMDEEGFVHITDRKKDIIIKGGENISPREIEEALYEHPAVAEAAVVAVPDEKFGENLVAVVNLRPGQKATAEEILEHVSKYVTKFKVPERVHFLPFLPKNPVGKILKKDLRKMMADLVKKQGAGK